MTKPALIDADGHEAVETFLKRSDVSDSAKTRILSDNPHRLYNL